MQKEKLMQLFSKALDKGASISIHFGQFDNHAPVFGSEALQLAIVASEAIGAEITESDHPEGVCKSFVVKKGDFRFDFSHSPRGYLEEDVDLSGGEENAEGCYMELHQQSI